MQPFFEAGFFHLDREAAALAHGVENHEIADGGGDSDAAGDGGGVFEGLCVPFAGVKRADDGGAARGLHADHAGHFFALEPAHFAQLIEGLPHADEAGAAACWVEDHVGQAPFALLCEFEAHRFFALDAVRLFERRDVEPVHRRIAFADDFAAVSDEAVDEVGFCACHRALVLVNDGRVGGHEDVGFESCAGGIGGHGSACVAGGGDGDAFDAEKFGHRDREGLAPRFEAAGGEDRLVLDRDAGAEFFGEARAGEERRHAFAERDDFGGLGHGQQFAVAPEPRLAIAEHFFGERVFDGGEVVADPDRAVFVERLEGIRGEALAVDGAFEVGYECHGLSGGMGCRIEFAEWLVFAKLELVARWQRWQALGDVGNWWQLVAMISVKGCAKGQKADRVRKGLVFGR
jgi:hypothetical protein